VVEAVLALGALPLLQPLDCLPGDLVMAAPLQVPAARVGPERPVTVGDAVPRALLHDSIDSLPPGAPAFDGGGWLAELAQPAGPLELQRP
jgi:hypothetical protein